MPEIADVDGTIRNWENNTLIKIPKQVLSLTGTSEKDGYIVYDNTESIFWFVVYSSEEKWVGYNSEQEANGQQISFTESLLV